MKTALIITSEYLGSANEIGSHQIAKQLAKMGISTIVISFPISPLYKFIPLKTDYIRRAPFSNKVTEVNENLHACIPKIIIPPLPTIVKKIPSYIHSWDKTSIKWAKILPTMTFDFVFCESLFFPNLLKQLSYKKLVVRLPDNFSGFWSNNPTLEQAEKNLIDLADIIISPSKLKKKELAFELPHKKILHLNNGFDIELYKPIYTKPCLYNDFKFNAIYVGAISSWFDMELLVKTASLKPNWQFTIIGKKPEGSLKLRSNIQFIGEKVGTDKIPYLMHANVGIIPFETKVNKQLIDYVNPIKMYEYLGAGIPVISTEWAELKLIKAPISLVQNATSFAEQLTLLEEASPEKQALIKFAEKFNWRTITQKLLTEITHEEY